VRLAGLGLALLGLEDPPADKPDPSEDVRALAALMVPLLGGRVEGAGGTRPVRFPLFTPTLERIPVGLTRVLRRCLEAEPAKRPSAAALRDALTPFAPRVAAGTSTRETPWAAARRVAAGAPYSVRWIAVGLALTLAFAGFWAGIHMAPDAAPSRIAPLPVERSTVRPPGR